MVKVIRKGLQPSPSKAPNDEPNLAEYSVSSAAPLLPEEQTPPPQMIADLPRSDASELEQAAVLGEGEGKDWDEPAIDATEVRPPPTPPARMAAVIDKETYAARSQAHVLIQQAEEQVQSMLDQAHKEAEHILQLAQEQAEQLRQAAQQEGMLEGTKQGSEQFAQALADLGETRAALEGNLVPQIGTIALKVARKILGRELHNYPESVVDVAKMALSEKARQRKDIIVRANPEDMAILRQEKVLLLEQLIRTKDLTLREDATVERGGVIIETESGTIDAQLHVQMAAFEAAFARL